MRRSSIRSQRFPVFLDEENHDYNFSLKTFSWHTSNKTRWNNRHYFMVSMFLVCFSQITLNLFEFWVVEEYCFRFGNLCDSFQFLALSKRRLNQKLLHEAKVFSRKFNACLEDKKSIQFPIELNFCRHQSWTAASFQRKQFFLISSPCIR